MLMLDMPMPERCQDCPLFRLHYDCGQCMGTAEKKWIEVDDYDKRQVWCPLKEGEQMPSAQLAQQLPNGCPDTISRWEAINLIERMKPYQQDADDIAEMIQNMPSAQPDWDEMIVICDCCGHTIHVQRQYAERKERDGNEAD